MSESNQSNESPPWIPVDQPKPPGDHEYDIYFSLPRTFPEEPIKIVKEGDSHGIDDKLLARSVGIARGVVSASYYFSAFISDLEYATSPRVGKDGITRSLMPLPPQTPTRNDISHP